MILNFNLKVPMISIPLSADQPLVAYRVCDELGLGVRLDFTTMTTDDIGQSICKVCTCVQVRRRRRHQTF